MSISQPFPDNDLVTVILTLWRAGTIVPYSYGVRTIPFRMRYQIELLLKGQSMSTEVEKQSLMNDEDAMRAITSYADAIQTIREAGSDVQSTVDFGDGFKLLTTEQKVQLVGVPFVIIDGRFNDGEQGEFLTLYLVTEDNRKVIINDGSTGIREQAKKYLGHRGTLVGLLCERGLIRSDYTYQDEKGATKPATTYYLS